MLQENQEKKIMSLFLTSDENVYGNDNTRTAFDNCIDQDFFARDGKNIALKEIFLMLNFQLYLTIPSLMSLR